MLITIYRIEDMNQGGVYRGDNCCNVPSDIYDEERHPLPFEDSGLVASFGGYDSHELSAYHFGFSSVDQLRNWFYRDDWLSMLSDYFKISLYTIDEEYVKIGYTQVCFKMSKAESYVQYNIAEFFNL